MYAANCTQPDIAAANASFGDGKQRMTCTAGFVIMMCGAATASGSHLQPTAALSTIEAQYMALAAAAQEVMFLRQLLTSVGIVERQPTRMFKDNKGCISLATNAMTTGKTKHIDIHLHFLRDLVQNVWKH